MWQWSRVVGMACFMCALMRYKESIIISGAVMSQNFTQTEISPNIDSKINDVTDSNPKTTMLVLAVVWSMLRFHSQRQQEWLLTDHSVRLIHTTHRQIQYGLEKTD